ncbi:MAG: AraC family transcriptional regulator [Phocaeicola sp.]
MGKRNKCYPRHYETESWHKPPRQLKLRTLKSEPQFKFDDIYFSVFSKKRLYEPDGTVYYVSIEDERKPTGVNILDDFADYLHEGHPTMTDFYKRHGILSRDLDSLCLLLTGIEAVNFRFRWEMRMADELLRYTNMTMEEVAHRSGIGSSTNLFYAYRRDLGCAPGERRWALREEGDLGRFAL